MAAARLETARFADDGDTVNHPELPLILMRGTEAAEEADPAAWFEERFAANGWGASWRWGVYPFHHFHTNNHEVLGVARGEAELLMGGANGRRFTVRTGDVVVIPAGVGHKCERSSPDFLVVGAYPNSTGPDLVRSGEAEPAPLRAAVACVPLPARDPVYGSDGPVVAHWSPGADRSGELG
jgi:uncharacterized protein YjlB